MPVTLEPGVKNQAIRLTDDKGAGIRILINLTEVTITEVGSKTIDLSKFTTPNRTAKIKPATHLDDGLTKKGFTLTCTELKSRAAEFNNILDQLVTSKTITEAMRQELMTFGLPKGHVLETMRSAAAAPAAPAPAATRPAQPEIDEFTLYAQDLNFNYVPPVTANGDSHPCIKLRCTHKNSKKLDFIPLMKDVLSKGGQPFDIKESNGEFLITGDFKYGPKMTMLALAFYATLQLDLDPQPIRNQAGRELLVGDLTVFVRLSQEVADCNLSRTIKPATVERTPDYYLQEAFYKKFCDDYRHPDPQYADVRNIRGQDLLLLDPATGRPIEPFDALPDELFLLTPQHVSSEEVFRAKQKTEMVQRAQTFVMAGASGKTAQIIDPEQGENKALRKFVVSKKLLQSLVHPPTQDMLLRKLALIHASHPFGSDEQNSQELIDGFAKLPFKVEVVDSLEDAEEPKSLKSRRMVYFTMPAKLATNEMKKRLSSGEVNSYNLADGEVMLGVAWEDLGVIDQKCKSILQEMILSLSLYRDRNAKAGDEFKAPSDIHIENGQVRVKTAEGWAKESKGLEGMIDWVAGSEMPAVEMVKYASKKFLERNEQIAGKPEVLNLKQSLIAYEAMLSGHHKSDLALHDQTEEKMQSHVEKHMLNLIRIQAVRARSVGAIIPDVFFGGKAELDTILSPAGTNWVGTVGAGGKGATRVQS